MFSSFKQLVLLILVFLPLSIFANNVFEHEKFNILLEPSGSYAILTIDAKPGVKFYWQNPGEVGMATKFSFEGSSNLQDAQIVWPIPKLEDDNGLASYIYKGKQRFLIIPKFANANKKIELKLMADFATCDDSCEAHQQQLKIDVLPNLGKTEEVIELLRLMPKKSDDLYIKEVMQEEIAGENWVRVKLIAQQKQENAQIFFNFPEHVSFDFKKIEVSNQIDGQLFSIPVKINSNEKIIKDLHVVLITDDLEVIDYQTKEVKSETHSFAYILFFALVGGLILNFMPCVLPVIALKIFQLTNLARVERKKFRQNILWQALGVVSCFIFIAIITYILQQLGFHVGFGLQFQQPAYLITMVLILSLVAINLVSDGINLALPQFLTEIFNSTRNDYIGYFLSGILITMLAVPCTAPFITIAVGYAITSNFIDMMLVFSLMGLGMATPYLMLAIFPASLRIFPKPGAWMNKFKKIVGALVFVSALWLIFVLSTQLGYKAALILFLLVILMKFILTEQKVILAALKPGLMILLLFFSYYMPFEMLEEKQQQQILNNSAWREFNYQDIPILVNSGHVVLVDVTASWCPSCILNKVTTLNSEKLMDHMLKSEIIGMRADISASSNEQVKKLMQDLQHFGIPLNVIYSKKFPNGKILPTILSPKQLMRDLIAAN
jgi:suppressor for copper-sensitivity B